MPPTKTEETIKAVLTEHIEIQRERLNAEYVANYASIALWFTLIGVLLSYLGIFPMVFGFIMGYFCGKNNPPIVDWLMLKAVDIIAAIRNCHQQQP